MANLREKYNKELRPALKDELGIENMKSLVKKKRMN